jgi:hypothetical protein
MATTGPYRPAGHPYPGVFIKGDDALYRFAPALDAIADGDFARIPVADARKALRELRDLLRSCAVEA